MKWLIRFFFFAVLIVVLVWAWMNPVKLWFSKPSFDSTYISLVKYDSVLKISDSLQSEIKNLQNLKEKQRNLVYKQERKIDKKIKEYKAETVLTEKVKDCDQFIEQYSYLQIQYNNFTNTSDSIIQTQNIEIKTKNTLLQYKDEQITHFKNQISDLQQQNLALKYDIEFYNKKHKTQKRIGLIVMGVLLLIAIK